MVNIGRMQQRLGTLGLLNISITDNLFTQSQAFQMHTTRFQPSISNSA